MSDDLVDNLKTVVLRMNKNFMKFMNLNYPWILKQRFPAFGTDISVADLWLCNLPELHVFGGIQYSFLLQEALNFSNII